MREWWRELSDCVRTKSKSAELPCDTITACDGWAPLAEAVLCAFLRQRRTLGVELELLLLLEACIERLRAAAAGSLSSTGAVESPPSVLEGAASELALLELLSVESDEEAAVSVALEVGAAELDEAESVAELEALDEGEPDDDLLLWCFFLLEVAAEEAPEAEPEAEPVAAAELDLWCLWCFFEEEAPEAAAEVCCAFAALR